MLWSLYIQIHRFHSLLSRVRQQIIVDDGWIILVETK